jgi:mevalonate kinase
MEHKLKIVGDKVYWLGEHVATLNEKALATKLDDFIIEFTDRLGRLIDKH